MKESRPPGLEVRNYKRGGVIEKTVGRLGALPTHIILGTPNAILKNVPEETAGLLKEKYKDIPWQGSVEVHLNRSPLFRQLRRLFQKERRANLFTRATLGLGTTVSSWLAGKFTRADLYNPYTETVQVFHANPAIAMHEVGHAVDYDKRKRPSLRFLARAIPGVANKQEWNASHNAMKHLDPTERDKAKKILEPAFGSYLGAPFAPFPVVESIASAAGVIAGHIHSRVGRKNIFYSESNKEHQKSKKSAKSESSRSRAQAPERVGNPAEKLAV